MLLEILLVAPTPTPAAAADEVYGRLRLPLAAAADDSPFEPIGEFMIKSKADAESASELAAMMDGLEQLRIITKPNRMLFVEWHCCFCLLTCDADKCLSLWLSLWHRLGLIVGSQLVDDWPQPLFAGLLMSLMVFWFVGSSLDCSIG